MVQTLIYRGGGDNGYGVYAHIIGTDYTFEVTQYDAHNINYNNTFSQAGDGFVFRSDDDNIGSYGGLYYSTGSGVTLLATDDNSNAITTPTAFSVFAGESVFVGTNSGVTNNAIPTVLMTTNGGAAPSVLLSVPIDLYTQAGGYLWAVSGGDLYRIDENRNPTLIYDSDGDNALFFDSIFEFNGSLYFRAADRLSNNDFYRVDPDTGVVTELNIGENGGGDSVYFWPGGVGDSKFYFWWNDGSGNGTELFVSDGTSGGTALVEDIRPGSSSSYVTHRTSPITVGDKLYFVANAGTSDGEELWVSDGTALGTFALSGTGTPVGALGFLSDMSAIPLGDELLFSAASGDGFEVFITDGTQAGTRLLIEINTQPSPYITSTDPTFWIAADGLVYFSIEDGPYEDSVWVTDGTTAGTRVVSDPNSGNGQREPWLLNIVDLQPDNIPLRPITGTEDADYLYGTSLRDTMTGGDGHDMFFAGAGLGDVLNGGAGIDYARYDDANYGDIRISLQVPALNTGAAEGDTYIDIEGVVMGSGNDWIYGDAGDNYLYGGGGNDNIFGSIGADYHHGGSGLDYARYDDAGYGDIVVSLAAPSIGTNVAAGDVFVEIEGLILGGGDDWIYGDNGDNYLYGNGGNDNLFGSNGADYLHGGAGIDYARFDDAGYAGLVADLVGANTNTGAAAGDTFVEIEGLILTGNNDYGFGNALDNYIYGLGGDDYLDGRGGNDFLFGGTGNDTFHFMAGYGRDTVGDFNGGSGLGDRLDLQGSFGSFAAVIAASTQVGANLEIALNGSDVLVLNNFSISNLAEDDVII